MADRTEHRKLIEQAQELTTEYVDRLEVWISSRRASVKTIKETASEIHGVKISVNISKVCGAAVGCLGGIAALVGTVVTGGLATPLMIGGIAAAFTGTATSTGAGFVGQYISSNKINDVQKILDADNQLIKEIEDKKAVVDVKVLELSKVLHLSEHEVFGALLMSSLPRIRGFVRMDNITVFQLVVSTGLVGMLHLSFQSGSIAVKGMGAFAVVSLKGLSKVLGAMAKGVGAGAVIILDICFLIENSIELSKGSPSRAADSLTEIAIQLEKQADDVETSLKIIMEEVKQYEMEVESFRTLLETVALQDSATDEQAKVIARFIRNHSSSEWWSAFLSLDVDLQEFAFKIANVFLNFIKLIENYQKEDEQKKKKKKERRRIRKMRPEKLPHLNITLIAHGGIDPRVNYPSRMYYMTPAMKSVRCYSPWGCVINAPVVYGIATNKIEIDTCRFSGPVVPNIPISFNTLPDNMDLTPMVMLRPVTIGEDAYQALMDLARVLRYPVDGLVIPYVTVHGVHLPDIPLWLCISVLGMAALVLRTTVSVRVAACLSPMNINAIARLLEPNGCYPGLTQYCQVPMNRWPPIYMTTSFPPEMRREDAEEFEGIIRLLFPKYPERGKDKKEEEEQH
ncbi:uncharacterized protein LOC128232319 [Mya arenaria]|uniref:uncharacterized protein LOC128232319 n=1 Tax=Mya arenaria TaxID=6604 RepID=UPI0022E277C7|nr:uncharacterized protein LOC128232319 [Mya arenaria]